MHGPGYASCVHTTFHISRLVPAHFIIFLCRMLQCCLSRSSLNRPARHTARPADPPYCVAICKQEFDQDAPNIQYCGISSSRLWNTLVHCQSSYPTVFLCPRAHTMGNSMNLSRGPRCNASPRSPALSPLPRMCTSWSKCFAPHLPSPPVCRPCVCLRPASLSMHPVCMPRVFVMQLHAWTCPDQCAPSSPCTWTLSASAEPMQPMQRR